VLYEIPTATRHVVTAGMFDDSLPTFDRKGDYLYFRRRGHFQPLYGELDQSFLYAGTEQLVLVPLRADQASPFAAKSDEEPGAKAKAEDEEKDAEDENEDGAEKVAEKTGSGEDGGEKAEDGEKKEKAEEPPKPVEIALDGFERRAVLLPIDPGVFRGLAVNDAGALVYLRGRI
jgi:tricorn protease